MRVAHPVVEPSDTQIEAAIVRVLEAENGARAATEAARSQAAARVEVARRAASEQAQRAERRVDRIRSAFEQRVEAARGEIEAEIGALAQSAGGDGELLNREADAVETLVAELTGGDHD